MQNAEEPGLRLDFANENGCRITYAAVREAHPEIYEMSLVGKARDAVIAAVNRGIDAHLEASFVPSRGDAYEHAEDRYVGRRLNCRISAESLPVLLRRLFESGDDESGLLASDILQTIGFNESGVFVGRED